MRLDLAVVTFCCCTGLFAQGAASTRFVYAITGAPASGVTVETMTETPAKYTTDGSGRIPAALPLGRVHVTDPKTGILLLDRGIAGPTPELEIATPIRVSGQVTGFGDDLEKIEIDVGYGERISVSDYQRLNQNLQIVRRPDEDTIHNMAIPPVHGQSVRLHPGPGGNFITRWFAALDAPQILVFTGADGRAAAKAVAIPKSIKPGTTVAAGKISPSFGATLEIHVNAPKSDLPLGLLVGVTSLDPGSSGKQQAAEMLSLLHRRDSEVSLFLVRRRELPLNFDGVTRIQGLPPMEALKLYFGGPITGVRVERTVKVPAQGVVRIDLSEEELLGKTSPRTTYSGVLRYERDAAPIANATVVYSSYPERKEVKTGPDGRFQFPNVVVGRPAVLFIDMANPSGRPPFDRTTFSKPVTPQAAAPSSAAAATEQVVEVKRPIAGGFQIPPHMPRLPMNLAAAAGGALLRGPQPLIAYQFPGCGQKFTQDDLQFGAKPFVTSYLDPGDNKPLVGPVVINGQGTGQVNGDAVYHAVFTQGGQYEVFLEYTPFVFSVATPNVMKANTDLFFSTPTNIPTLQIQVIGKNNSRVPANVLLNFYTYSPETDPFEMLTDSNGTVTINCLTFVSDHPELQNLPVFVNDPTYGYYDGNIQLTKNMTQVQLQLGNPPTTTSSAVRPTKK